MTRISLTGLALATACVAVLGATLPAHAQRAGVMTQLVTNGPQYTPGDQAGTVAAQQNVRESTQYEALLRSNSGFRAVRMQKECGPISDPQLRASCIASFGPADYAAIPGRHSRGAL